jgi:phosphohistidine phosphatase SixA
MSSKEVAIKETPEKEDAGKKEESPTRYELYIMRHGIAVVRGSYSEDDSKRPLTPAGKKKVKEIANGLKRLGVVVDWIVTSPLVRKRVLVTGHEPDLSELAARLIGAGRHANLAFKKGGCCLVEFDQMPPKSPGELVWWATPRLLRKVD